MKIEEDSVIIIKGSAGYIFPVLVKFWLHFSSFVVNFPNHSSDPSLYDTCNQDCKCNTAFPSFVCDQQDQTTYFSQCHAGCLGGELNDPTDPKSVGLS